MGENIQNGFGASNDISPGRVSVPKALRYDVSPGTTDECSPERWIGLRQFKEASGEMDVTASTFSSGAPGSPLMCGFGVDIEGGWIDQLGRSEETEPSERRGRDDSSRAQRVPGRRSK